MNDTHDIKESGQPEGPLAGQRLAAARKERDISIFDIAKELHLDEHKVQALEENRFETLGAPVFAKGHLRKYAELVGVPIEDILADYYAMNRSVGAPPVVGRARQPERDIQLGPWLLGIVILLIVAATAYWWFNRVPVTTSPGSAITESETRLELPQPEAPAGRVGEQSADPQIVDNSGLAGAQIVTDVQEVPVDTALPENSGRVPADTVETAAETLTANTALMPADGSRVNLAMSFSGDCWTEVTDAAGARLFFDLGSAGRTIRVSGEPPLRVLFGNSENVTVMVDGRDYPISDAMRRGQTARLTINSQ